MSEESTSSYIGVEWDSDHLLWFAFGDIELAADEEGLGWATSAEDAAWIREGVVVLGSRLGGEDAPRNFPDAADQVVDERIRDAMRRFDEWLAEHGAERPSRRHRLLFNAEEVLRELRGAGLASAPSLAHLAGALDRGDLREGAHTTDDWLRSLDEGHLVRLVELFESEDPDEETASSQREDAAPHYTPAVERVTLVAALVWLETGGGLDSTEIDERATTMLTMAAMELAKRHGFIEFEGERRLTDPHAKITVRATPKGQRLAEGEPAAPDEDTPGAPPVH